MLKKCVMEYIETETTRKISELGRNYVKIIMANISYANSMFKYLLLFLHFPSVYIEEEIAFVFS